MSKDAILKGFQNAFDKHPAWAVVVLIIVIVSLGQTVSILRGDDSVYIENSNLILSKLDKIDAKIDRDHERLEELDERTDDIETRLTKAENTANSVFFKVFGKNRNKGG